VFFLESIPDEVNAPVADQCSNDFAVFILWYYPDLIPEGVQSSHQALSASLHFPSIAAFQCDLERDPGLGWIARIKIVTEVRSLPIRSNQTTLLSV
jgi:hypothetical protein